MPKSPARRARPPRSTAVENAPPEQNSAAPASAVASPKANDGSSAPAPPEDEAPNRDLRLTPSPTAENQGTAPRNERMDDSSGPPVTLRLSVIHAGLEHASYPIAVGHYNGDVLTGAEWVLDDRLNSKLSSRRAMNLYPGPESTAEVVLAPGLAPPGALVIGLGEVGELTSDIVTRGIVVATLRLALARLEEPAEDEGQTGCRAVAFSTLLIGTRGGRALAIESSIAAVVSGALLANRALRDAKLIEKVCISEIQFVEIYEELAIRTAHALCEIERSLRLARTKNEILAPAPYLLRGEGGFAGRPASDYDSGWWRRLQISQPAGDSGQLDFLLLTERARAERSMQATQRALVERLVEKTIHETSYDLNIPATLYELLVPNELKNQPLESANLLLVVDGAAAQYPWEMMAERRFMEDRVDNRELRPLAVHMGMLRQLTTARHRTLVQGPRKRTALVIGEPKLSDPNYPPLPGARAEAQAVVEVLSAQKYEVTALIETDAIAIVDALFSQEYRIIHIAGHGLYRPEHPEQSGVVLGDGIFLTAAEIGQLRIVPEMVFLNCCHLGRTDQPVPLPEGDLGQTQRAWNRLAASVAQALIEIGVRTVVAAGWAVNDSAAQVFATTLYGLLLDAEQSLPFGEAVCAARRKLYDDPQLGRTNTWGAYQCYGDPGFILNMQAKQEGGNDEKFVAPDEVIRRLRNVQARASHIEDRGWLTRLTNQTKALEERVRTKLPADWLNGELLNEFGNTYAELRNFPAAITRYRQALCSSSPNERVPFRTAEQLANLESRFAVDLINAGKSAHLDDENGRWDAQELLQSAETRLRLLLAMAETAERWSLLGGYYKRQAFISSDEGYRTALNAAADSYRKAYEISSAHGSPYSDFNWVTCRVLTVDALSEEERTALLGEIEASRQALARRESTERSFWDLISRPDAALAAALVTSVGGASEIASHQINEIARLYRNMMTITGTRREQDTVLGNLDFLSEMLTRNNQTTLAAAIQRIRELVAQPPQQAEARVDV